MIRIRLPLVVVLAFVTPACSKDSATATTSASVARTTETFTGTVQAAGGAVHGFTVSQTGQVDVTLTAAGPPSTIVMGLGVGTPVGSTCVPFAGASISAQAGTTPQLPGEISPGALCLEIHAIGNQTAAVTYTVTVTHP
jgi:hypothetical protein